MAPLAFWQALMEQGKTRDLLVEEVNRWLPSERKELNLKAATLDLNQSAPGNKTILQWFEWLADLVYNSLDERAVRLNIASERKYIEPFIDSVLSKGIFTLQSQEQFTKEEKSVKEFIMTKVHNV